MLTQQAPDYLAIGHVTVDLYPDGRPVLGGTALYAALTAARFGLRAAVLTRGNLERHGEEIVEDLARFAREIALIVQEAQSSTVFTNRTVAGRREQTIHAWAGAIDLNGVPPHWRSAKVVHLAPVAQEIDPRQASRLNPGYLGVTPQGWMRQWPRGHEGRVRLAQLRLPLELLSRIDALVLSSVEHTLARDEIEAVGTRGLVAITRGADGAQLIDRGRVIDVPAYPVPVRNDLGAGDVFAAVLFLLRAEREPVSLAARMASAAAALRIQGEGPEAVPTRAQVEAFLESRGELRRP
jgi:sugar/nucleoside kinase (ribokinase family)